ncbi:hypothetical protein H6F76_07455 [Leptolyngbya sp. FACHB-321]|uniref:hypothetical protein n=1 Tax=Leptolyngbya sp. FACHB-321 TaxID=2692807 RepID=UPI0016824425|nr:hypothetical protein [Leptolyngbya sp. FACHB-321]MBD2034867.1 hypothetical protein [Leptolyngbya sp. FACHB-321]
MLPPATSQTTGALALLLGNASRQQDLECSQQVLHGMAVTCPGLDARWAFRTVQRHLTADEVAWFEDAIARIRHHQ